MKPCAALFFLLAWLCAVPAQTATPTPSPAPVVPPLGSIKGRVLDEGGRPLPDIPVRAYAAGVDDYEGKSGVTDTKGRFELKNLAPAAYSLNVYSAVYIQPPEASRAADGSLVTYQLGDNVTLRLVKGGVITGRVTDANNQPQVDINVQAVRQREPNEPLARYLRYRQNRSATTDDRGVYRLYGLLPGRYIVRAGGASSFSSNAYGAYEGESPTYFPSDTLDTATAVTVQSGEEVAAIDVRHRATPGRSVSGVIKGVPDSYVQVSLSDARSFNREGESFLQSVSEGRQSFSFHGLPDGDYLLAAQSDDPARKESVAATLRLTVKGADLTGLELNLSALASIAGRVTLAQETNPPCANQREATLPELLASVRRERLNPEKELPHEPYIYGNAAPKPEGDFKIKQLAAGTYRLRLKLPNEDWYLRSLNRAEKPPHAKTPPKPSIPDLIALSAGQKLTGLEINLANGAAAVRGRVVSATEGAALPRLRLHLLPAEREKADNTLLYRETTVAADGAFAFANLAPGRYLLLARPLAPDADESELRPLAWDAKQRAQLRRDAETAAHALELKPCQRFDAHELRFAPQ